VKSTFLIALALAGANAHATTIIALFNGEVSSEAIQRFIVNDPTNPGWVDTTTGEFTFTQTGATYSGLAATFVAFCIEPREFVSGGSTYTYNLVPLDQGTTNIGGMGAAKAALLDELFGRYYPTFGAPLDAEHASALQIATWEIVRELPANPLNVSSGNISFRNPQDAPALTLAQTYLSSLNGQGPMAANLAALDEVGAQDVVVQLLPGHALAAPEPASYATAGLALVGLSLLLRRRRVHATAVVSRS